MSKIADDTKFLSGSTCHSPFKSIISKHSCGFYIHFKIIKYIILLSGQEKKIVSYLNVVIHNGIYSLFKGMVLVSRRCRDSFKEEACTMHMAVKMRSDKQTGTALRLHTHHQRSFF